MRRTRVGVLISGRGSNMAALLEAAQDRAYPAEIALVLSNNPDAAGLGTARAAGVEARAIDHRGRDKASHEAELTAALRSAGVEVVALAGYMRLLSPEFVSGWPERIVNVHPSLLPEYKGLDTHARAIEAGDAVAGCSVHIVTAELDDGPVLGQAQVAILPGDTLDSLSARVLIAEHQLYPRCLAAWVSREHRPETKLERLRAIAAALPGSEETVSHGMPSFRISKGKMFAYFTHDHHGDGSVAAIVKTSGSDEQAMLIDQDPDTFFRPAYLGPSGWIGIRLDIGRTDWDQVGARVAASWRLVAPRKLFIMQDS